DVLQAVEDRYLISSDVTEERMDYVEELFAVLETVNHPDPTPDQSDDEETEEDQKEQEEESLAEKSSTDKLQEFKQIVSQEITDHIDDEELLTLITASDRERQISYELLTTTLQEIFSEGIQENQLDDAKAQLTQRFQFSSLSDELKGVLISIGEFALVENSFFSLEATMEAEAQALNNVEPAMIRAGEVLVLEGQTITNE